MALVDPVRHRYTARVRGRSVVVVGSPSVWSWDHVNPGTAALLEVARIEPADRVLDLGCGTGVLGAVAALEARQGESVLVDCNAAAVECARQTLEANGVTNAQVLLGDGCSILEPESFDLVLCHLPREPKVQEELLRGAAAVLRPGGSLYFVAHREAGIRAAVDFARTLFGRCGVIYRKKGYHVAMALRPAGRDYTIPLPAYETHVVDVDGVPTQVVGKPGVFAWDRLDRGTQALIGAMEIGPTEEVLDLGCGTGLVGVAAARRAHLGRVILIDIDLRAVEAARRTLEANGVTNAVVALSDCGLDLPGGQLDVVVTNPPFHRDREVDRTIPRRFIGAAARLLRPHGRLYLVANRFLTYDRWLQEGFRQVEEVWRDSRYRVWRASRPLAPPSDG